MKMKRLSLIVFSVFFLLSCTRTSDPTIEMLQKADEYMEAYPDTALLLLQAIQNPEKLTGEKQANYGLLMTQALDKNYEPILSDSLIQLAINYYEKSTNNISQGKAYFYYGRYLYEKKQHKEALNAFLKSQKILENSDQYKLLGLLAEYIGNINLQSDWSDEALSNYRKSLEYYMLVGDSLSMTFSLRNIGRIYIHREDMDSAIFYAASALKIAVDHRLRSESALLHELSVISRVTGDYEKAESYMLASVDKTNDDDLYLRYNSLANMYFQAGRYDEAEEYLNKALGSIHPNTLLSTYDALYRLELQKRNYKEAIVHIEKRDSLHDAQHNIEHERNIVELQEKYRNEYFRSENLQIRNDRNTIVLLSIIVILIASIIAVYHYSLNMNNKRKIREIEQAINQNEIEIQNYKMELLSMNEQQDDVSELKGKIALLTNQNKDYAEKLFVLGHEKVSLENSDPDTYVIALRIILAMKEGGLKRKLSDYDVEILIKLFNFLYNDFVTRLTSEFKELTKHEIELCCLLKIRLTNQELCLASNTTVEAVRRAKKRLMNHLRIPDDETLESYLASY